MLSPLDFADAARDQNAPCALCSNKPPPPQQGTDEGDPHVNTWLLPYEPQQQGCPSKMGREKVPQFASVFLCQDKENRQVRGYRLVAGDGWAAVAEREVSRELDAQAARTWDSNLQPSVANSGPPAGT